MKTNSRREGGECLRNGMKECDRRLGFKVKVWKLSGRDWALTGHMRALGTRVREYKFGASTIMLKVRPSPLIMSREIPQNLKGEGHDRAKCTMSVPTLLARSCSTRAWLGVLQKPKSVRISRKSRGMLYPCLACTNSRARDLLLKSK